jgi:hypothetical protein
MQREPDRDGDLASGLDDRRGFRAGFTLLVRDRGKLKPLLWLSGCSR